MASEVVDLEAAGDVSAEKVQESNNTADVIQLDDDDDVEVPRPARENPEAGVTGNKEEIEPMVIDADEKEPEKAAVPEKEEEPSLGTTPNVIEETGKIGVEGSSEIEPTQPISIPDSGESKAEIEVIDVDDTKSKTLDGSSIATADVPDGKPKAEDQKNVDQGESEPSAKKFKSSAPVVGNGEVKSSRRTSDDTPQHKTPRLELHSVPTRQYLDQTVVPILLHGMSALSRDRPSEPIEYLADYLLKHKSQYAQKSNP